MSTWHYADRHHQQQGPVDATWLQAAYARGEVDGATLVWREGLPAWCPLAQVAGELGIAGAPPPMPPRPRAPVAPAKSGGLSGCAIVAIAVGIGAIPVLGILLAIAIPAYQDYTLRAKVAQGLTAAAPLKLAVQETWLSEERCPTHEDPQVQAPEHYGDSVVRSVTLGDDGDGACTVTVRYLDMPTPGEEGVLVLVRDGDGWRYRSSLDQRYLPASIRSRAEPIE